MNKFSSILVDKQENNHKFDSLSHKDGDDVIGNKTDEDFDRGFLSLHNLVDVDNRGGNGSTINMKLLDMDLSDFNLVNIRVSHLYVFLSGVVESMEVKKSVIEYVNSFFDKDNDFSSVKVIDNLKILDKSQLVIIESNKVGKVFVRANIIDKGIRMKLREIYSNLVINDLGENGAGDNEKVYNLDSGSRFYSGLGSSFDLNKGKSASYELWARLYKIMFNRFNWRGRMFIYNNFIYLSGSVDRKKLNGENAKMSFQNSLNSLGSDFSINRLNRSNYKFSINLVDFKKNQFCIKKVNKDFFLTGVLPDFDSKEKILSIIDNFTTKSKVYDVIELSDHLVFDTKSYNNYLKFVSSFFDLVQEGEVSLDGKLISLVGSVLYKDDDYLTKKIEKLTSLGYTVNNQIKIKYKKINKALINGKVKNYSSDFAIEKEVKGVIKTNNYKIYDNVFIIEFDFNSYFLDDEVLNSLEKYINSYVKKDFKIHLTSIPGKYDDIKTFLWFSMKRIKRIKDYLTNKGIDKNIIKSISLSHNSITDMKPRIEILIRKK